MAGPPPPSPEPAGGGRTPCPELLTWRSGATRGVTGPRAAGAGGMRPLSRLERLPAALALLGGSADAPHTAGRALFTETNRDAAVLR